uniref:Uncharacterized protein n=1 Tax=Glossina pallidipes TaxID=7398 RepID=A0A1A9ZYF8_GLOPL
MSMLAGQIFFIPCSIISALSELDAVSETRGGEGTALKRVMLNSLRAKLSSRLVHCMTSSCTEVLIERRSSFDRLNALAAGVLVVVFVGDFGGGGTAFFGGGCGILSPIFIASITRSSARFKLITGSCGCEDTCNLPKLTTTADCLPGRKIPPIGKITMFGMRVISISSLGTEVIANFHQSLALPLIAERNQY